MAILRHPRMPTFGGATGWLNSEPLGPDELRGRVVVVDFWTLTCINWLRTEPYVRAWSQAYRDDGLTVIGVHTPEFSFEHERGRVELATKEMKIDYPVALDNAYGVWQAFDNHYWPALYFVDKDGVIRDMHFGEGRYEESERVIQRLLGVERGLVSVCGEGVEAEADWDNLRSPETYLGYSRRERLGTLEGLQVNQWGLAGEWASGPENVVLERGGGSIAYRFHARDAHLVLSRGTNEVDSVSCPARRRAPRALTRNRYRRAGRRPARRRTHVPAHPSARRRARPDRRDHLPRAGRRGLRVHVRLAATPIQSRSSTARQHTGSS